jgi:uncharacterized membrane protein (UPF0182 family)
MEPTLDGALADLFGTPTSPSAPTEAAGPGALRQPGLAKARALLDEARAAMEQGNWEKFGSAMQGLELQLPDAPAH